MILLNLKLENFKKYKNFKIDFSLGLIGIIGKNGSGKSTIFEAILFALYGELKNKAYKEIIRNSDASTKDAVVVELIFEFENCEYKIIREFRGKALSANAKLYKNEDLVCTGARDVTSRIISLIKMNKEAFLATLFSSQKELNALSSLKNEDRKRMIRKLLGLEKIDFVENELIQKSRALKREIQAFAEVLLSSEDEEDKLNQISLKEIEEKSINDKINLENISYEKEEKELKRIKTKIEEFKNKALEKQKAFNTLNITKHTIANKEEYLNKLIKDLKDLEVKQKDLNLLKSVKDEYKSLYEKIKVHIINKEQIIKKEALEKEQLSLREQYSKAKNDISILEKECCEYDNLIIKDKNLSLDLKELKSILKEEKEKEKEIQILIASEKNIISQTNEKMLRIQELGKTSSCPICTRPLLDEYDNVLTSLNVTINEIQKNKIDSELLKLEILSSNIKDSELKYETFNSEYIHLSQRINLIESKKKDLLFSREHFEKVKTHGLQNKEELELLKDYVYSEDEHKSDANQYNELKEKYEYVLELETLIKRVDILKVEESKTRKELKDFNELKIIQDKLFEDIIYIKEYHTKEEVLYSQVENKVKEINTIINNLKVEIANIQGEIKVNLSILENNSKHKNKVKDKQNDLLEYDLIKSSLTEFKRKLNAKIAPRISDISSKMFASITKGKYEHIEVNNDFDFFIYDNGKKYPIERFSGGEIDLANLVLRIAISKTLSELNSSSSIEFLAFDEVFGSQDESRRMEIIEAFHTIKEQYRQIFLISHEIDIKEMFETVIEV